MRRAAPKQVGTARNDTAADRDALGSEHEHEHVEKPGQRVLEQPPVGGRQPEYPPLARRDALPVQVPR